MARQIFVGIGAGLVSALLFASIATQTALGVAIGLLAGVPVLIAGLGWGAGGALIAALTSAGVFVLGGAPRPALMHALAIGLPSIAFTYYALLNRDLDGDPDIPNSFVREWYPIGRILAGIAVWAGMLGAVTLLASATTSADLVARIKPIVAQYVAQGGAFPGSPPGGIDVDQVARYAATMMAGSIAAMWMIFFVVNAVVAGRVTAASGQLGRPWPALAMVSLPKLTPVIFMALVAATYLGDYLGLIASGFVAGLMLAYMLVGLAIIHHTTQGLSLRPLVLGLTYLSLLVLNPFSSFFIAMLGLAEPFSPLRRTPTGPPPD